MGPDDHRTAVCLDHRLQIVDIVKRERFDQALIDLIVYVTTLKFHSTAGQKTVIIKKYSPVGIADNVFRRDPCGHDFLCFSLKGKRYSAVGNPSQNGNTVQHGRIR